MKIKLHLILVILVSIIIEIIIFNYSYIMDITNENLNKNIEYKLKDIKATNWSTDNNYLVSQPDPMLTINNINIYVRNVKLDISKDKDIPFIMVYYTKNKDDIFNDNMSIALTKDIENINYIKLNSYINNLRIDLGDESGLRLTDLTVIINPVKLNFSLARVIAMILIYFSSIGLFALQKSPKYDLLIQDDRSEEIENSN